MWPDDPLEVYVTADEYPLVQTTREQVAAVAAEWDVAHVEDLLLIVDELVTNGLDHGGTTVKVECHRRDARTIEVRVTDQGGGDPHLVESYAGGTKGRGLLIVDRLAREWGVEQHPGGKTVWVAFSPAGDG
jgi:anti-sigma regulatory factor (Ser/Thr protein kinase)